MDGATEPKVTYKRVLLKISGEALMGDQGFGLHPPTVARIAALCRAHGIVVPVSLFERAGQAHYNSVVVVDAEKPVGQRWMYSSSRSRRSSITTTTAATTRASTISPLPTSTSGAAISSRWKGKGSNAKPSNSAACFIEMQRPNVTNLMDQSLR